MEYKVNLTVSPLNNQFKMIDGNLYTADEKMLVLCIPKENETSFSIPEGVTQIGDYAFHKVKYLKTIYIPRSVQSIGYYALSDIDIYFNGKKSEWEKIMLTVDRDSSISRVNVTIGETIKNKGSYYYIVYSKAKVHFKTLFGYTK